MRNTPERIILIIALIYKWHGQSELWRINIPQEKKREGAYLLKLCTALYERNGKAKAFGFIGF